MRIPIEQQIIAIVFSVVLLLVTIQLVRKHKLREEYALVWLGASATIFVLTIFDKLVIFLAVVFGVTYAPTLIFVFGLMFCIVVILSQSVTASTQADRIRDLAQTLGILECRLHQLELTMQKGGTVDAQTAPNQSLAPSVLAGDRPESSVGELAANNTESSEASSAVAVSSRADPHAVGRAPAPSPDSSSPDKVLVIGLDGATFDLIKPWAADGYLPTLKRVMEEGAQGTLRSTVPPMTGPAWTSFATGVNPGKHRLYDWIAREPDSYKFTPVTALDCQAPTIYSLLSQAGRRVCSLNVPMTYPPTPVNGVMVSGLPAPSTRVNITYPRELYEEIVRNVGDYILYPDPGQAYSDSGVDAFLQRLYKTADLRVRTLDYLRQRENWDFAMVVFSGTDTISHALWKYMDKDHPLHDPQMALKYGTAIRDYYQHIDTQLAGIVETLAEDTTLVIMSDHGFGPFHKFIHVNNWLLQEGFMQVQPGLRSGVKRRLFQGGFSPMNVYDTLMRFGLGSLKREVVRGQGQGLLKTLFLSFEDIDWQRTQAYSLGNVGQIYINVAGREPNGCVQPGAEYEAVRDRVIAQLNLLRDPETGEHVVESVFRREDLYQGDYLEQAPDIVFLPRRLEYFGFGEYEFGSHKIIEPMRRGISGTHRMNGIFLAYGDSVRPGTQVDDASLYDLAPTILQLMGEPIPAHMDGRVLDEILANEDEHVTRSREPWIPAQADQGTTENGLSDEDKEILAERLRSLGYVG